MAVSITWGSFRGRPLGSFKGVSGSCGVIYGRFCWYGHRDDMAVSTNSGSFSWLSLREGLYYLVSRLGSRFWETHGTWKLERLFPWNPCLFRNPRLFGVPALLCMIKARMIRFAGSLYSVHTAARFRIISG